MNVSYLGHWVSDVYCSVTANYKPQGHKPTLVIYFCFWMILLISSGLTHYFSLLFCCNDKTLINRSLREEIVCFILQCPGHDDSQVIEGSQDRSSSRNLEAETESGNMEECELPVYLYFASVIC